MRGGRRARVQPPAHSGGRLGAWRPTRTRVPEAVYAHRCLSSSPSDSPVRGGPRARPSARPSQGPRSDLASGLTRCAGPHTRCRAHILTVRKHRGSSPGLAVHACGAHARVAHGPARPRAFGQSRGTCVPGRCWKPPRGSRLAGRPRQQSEPGRSRLQSEPERSSATRCVRPGSSGRSGPLLTCSAAPGRPRAPSFGTTLKWPPPGSHFAPPRPAGLRAGSPSGLPLPASFAGQHGYRRIGAWSHALPDRAGPSSTLVVKPSSRLAVPGSGQSYRHVSRSRPAPSGASCPALRLREVIRREDRPELSAEPGRGCRPLPRIRFDGSCTSSRWTRVHR